MSLNKALLMGAVTFKASNDGNAEVTGQGITLAAVTAAAAIEIETLGISFFNTALENIATLRAENGGSTSRLQFALEQTNRTRTNLEAANGRIVDVDIAEETTRLAKYNILVQASAAMLAQANMSPSSALMLLQ